MFCYRKAAWRLQGQSWRWKQFNSTFLLSWCCYELCCVGECVTLWTDISVAAFGNELLSLLVLSTEPPQMPTLFMTCPSPSSALQNYIKFTPVMRSQTAATAVKTGTTSSAQKTNQQKPLLLCCRSQFSEFDWLVQTAVHQLLTDFTSHDLSTIKLHHRREDEVKGGQMKVDRLVTFYWSVMWIQGGFGASLFICTKITNSNGRLDAPDWGNLCIHQCHSAEFIVCGGVAPLII